MNKFSKIKKESPIIIDTCVFMVGVEKRQTNPEYSLEKMKQNWMNDVLSYFENIKLHEVVYKELDSDTRKIIDEHRGNFHHEIDVRGMRSDEALMKTQHFIDDAILMGMNRVRILHGKGDGILRTLIRQYLEAIPNVISCKDEHVQFGGAGITVVEIG